MDSDRVAKAVILVCGVAIASGIALILSSEGGLTRSAIRPAAMILGLSAAAFAAVWGAYERRAR